MSKKPIAASQERVYIFDLDGCIYNDDARQHLINWKARAFAAYHARSPYDTLLTIGPALLRLAIREKEKGAKVLIFTARPESEYEATVKRLLRDFPGLFEPKVACYEKYKQLELIKGLDMSSPLNYDTSNMFMRRSHEEGIPSADLKASYVSKASDLGIIGPHSFLYIFDDHIDVVSRFNEDGYEAWLCNRDRLIFAEASVCSYLKMDRNDGTNHTLSGYEFHLDDHFFGFIGYNDFFFKSIPQDNNIVQRLMNDPTICARLTDIRLISIQSRVIRKEIDDASAEYFRLADKKEPEPKKPEPKPMAGVDVILRESADVMTERREVYGDNYLMVGKIMEILFPNGVELTTPEDHNFFHMFGHVIGKLTRFAAAGCKHEDSITDLINYAAFCKALMEEHNIKLK